MDTSFHIFMDVLFNDFNVILFSIMCFPTSCRKACIKAIGEIQYCFLHGASAVTRKFLLVKHIKVMIMWDIFHIFCLQELLGTLCLFIVGHLFRLRTAIMTRGHQVIVQYFIKVLGGSEVVTTHTWTAFTTRESTLHPQNASIGITGKDTTIPQRELKWKSDHLGFKTFFPRFS